MSTHQPEVMKWAVYLEGFFISEEVSASTARKIAAELRRLHQQELALIEWLDKTEWVQASIQAKELGQHRADVIKQRLDLVTGQRDELLHAAKRMQAWVLVLLNHLDVELDSFEMELSNSKTGDSVTLSLKEYFDEASAAIAKATKEGA